MEVSGKLHPDSSVLMLILLTGLLTFLSCWPSATGTVYGASPTINYSTQQMSVNGTQTLTVSGSCDGPYGWSVVGGAGSLSSTEGSSTTYTAPPTNSNCVNNPSISVSCNGEVVDTCHMAVTNTGNGYAIFSCCQPGPPLGAYHCENFCTCGGVWLGTDQTCLSYCGQDSGHLGYNPCNPEGEIDIRSEEQKAAGCCPAGLIDQGSGGASQTGNTGGDCSINKKGSSSTNLKSGNLYHDQNVGILSLSYNSIDTNDGPLGKKWTHQYNEKVTLLSDNSTSTLRTDDGNIIYFHLSGGVFYPEAISGDTSRIVKNGDNTYTRTLKNGTAHGFNTSGYLTSIADRNGNTTTLTYSGTDIASITDTNGRTTTFGSSSGKIMSMTDPAGRTYNFVYTSGFLTSITDPLNNVWQYTYNTAGRMLTKTDPAGHIVTYMYDASGLLLTSTDPEGDTRTMNYTQSGTTVFTEKDGGTWTYQYDPTFAVKTQQTDPLGNITRYGYDLKRNLVLVTDPSGGITRYTYDGNSNLASVTDPLNHTTSYTYNALNLIASRTDPKGGVTTYSYDTKGNLTSTTDPAGTTTFQYDTKGNITTITDADNRTTVLTYDAHNNLTGIADPLGHTTTFTYDAVGNRLTMTDPMNHATTYVYNALNQMTQVTDPLGHITHFTYDYQGNVLTTTDANNKPTAYQYNYRGQRTRITDALNHITQMGYGPTGCGGGCGGAEKLTSLTDALNHVTGYSYDLAGRMTKETDPKGQEILSTYDARGNLHTRTKPDGRTITYTYDAADRLITKQYPGGGLTQYQYDANGNMTYAANSAIAYNFTYDANNRLTTVIDSNAKTIQYQYSAAGNRTAVVTPENKTIAYTYDSVGRPATVASDGRTFTFAYDATNRRTSLAFPNGTAAAYTYDNNGNLTQIRHTGPGSTVLVEVNHTYDAVNNRLTRTDNSTAGIDTSITETMTYNVANEMLSLNTASYGYDANGNRILKTDMSGSTAYTYDDENRLVRVETDGGQVITYTYDPLGRRIEKNVNGTITRYLYDQEDILLEYDQAGTVAARYLHGPGIDEPLAMEKNGQMYYYQADGLGSVIALTDSAGGIVQTYRYDAFGKMMIGTPTITQPYAYTGREYDPETGLYYYRARYYDPKVGRFVTKDPIGFEGRDVNHYAYVGNNAANRTDPTGLYMTLFGPRFEGADGWPWYGGWPFNGSPLPGYDNQDNVCSYPAQYFNKNSCTKKCCQAHDDCFTRFGCNWTSLLGNIINVNGACQMCNWTAVFCVMRNIGENDDCQCQ